MPAGSQGNTLIWLVVIVIVVGLAFWYFMQNGYKFPQQTAQGIMTTADLDTATRDLDGTNLNQMDTGISQISADSSSF